MAIKSANVAARVEPEIKEQAEAIMNRLGIPASTAINMFYRQVILWNGMPFRPAIPNRKPLSRDEMSKDEFNARMTVGYEQAKADKANSVDKVFSTILNDLDAGLNG